MNGITPYDFVQRVYYAQEKVVLDFQPGDDKYKEVLMEGNTVIREFQDEEDWSFLRDRITLGFTEMPHAEIPEFELPEHVTKVSTLHGDGVRLHWMKRHGGPDEHRFLYIPWGSKGIASYRDNRVYDEWGFPGGIDHRIRAIQLGRTITFNQPIPLHLAHRYPIVTTDVQRRLELFDLNDVTDEYRDHTMLEEIPNVDYIVIKAAMYHSYGSPVASGRAMDLQDQAQKLLSSMRDNDAAHTAPDIVYSQPLNYIDA